MEPPGDAAGSVFVTEGRTHLHLNREAVVTDVALFEAALAAAARSKEAAARDALVTALGWYTGPLLPGYYEPWALSERDRLSEAQVRALLDLSLLWEQAGEGADWDQALDCARRAVSSDPLREESHARVIRLLMRSGQGAAARRQFEELSRLLREHYDSEPEPETRALLDTKATAPVKAPATATTTTRDTAATVPASAPVVPIAPAPAQASVDSVGPEDSVESVGLFHHFPLTLTRFFGREAEMAALRAQLVEGETEGQTGDTRLVTITGPGGSGKTRFAVETARSLGRHFPGGIWFVPLVDVREAERLPEALAAALGTGEAGSGSGPLREVLEALSSAASRGRCLLVLDNFEQLAETGASVVAALLHQVPGLHCLVTSRQRLRIEGEREFALVPLPTPEYPGTPERLVEFASVALFVSRAQGARADFQLTGRNAAAVAGLCSRLEGMPLAIELAAAWMSVLSPSQMLERLARRLGLLDVQVLVSRRRDVSPRHRTLRAAIESSVSLLSEPVRGFFASLSVFRGGWTLAAAEQVCGEPGEPMALEYLTELADHSLIVRVGEEVNAAADRHGSGYSDEVTLRFRMLETLREYAEELFQEMGYAVVSEAEDRYITFFTRLAEEGTAHLTGPSQGEWMRRLHTDEANMRTMLDLLDRKGKTVEALRIGGLLTGFWQIRGYLSEGRQLLSHLLERAGETAPPLLRAQALSGIGKFAYTQGDYDVARPSHETCLEIYRAEGDASGVARPYASLATVRC
jgi:predicted ATPase/DNA-binding SARP family transcriptional activator